MPSRRARIPRPPADDCRRADAYRIYGRRRGRKLRAGRQRLLDELLPRLQVPLPAVDATLDPAALFRRTISELWLEIGFGSGEHLAAQALARPDVGMIGCEPFVNGVASLLAVVEERDLGNVRIHPNDARPLLAALRDASVDRVFILFPDPWPKTRQHKRRLVADATLDALARIMRDESELRLATDAADYLAWMIERATRHPAFDWMAEGPDDWRERPADWPPTRYEAKATAQGRRCAYLRFRRRCRAGRVIRKDAQDT